MAQRSERAPGRPRGDGNRPDSTATYEEVTIVESTLPSAEGEPSDRLLTPQDVADLIGTWLELAAPPFVRSRTAGVAGRLLKVREVAEFLDVSPGTVMRWTRRGELPGFRLPSGALRYREDELAAWLEARSTRG